MTVVNQIPLIDQVEDIAILWLKVNIVKKIWTGQVSGVYQ